MLDELDDVVEGGEGTGLLWGELNVWGFVVFVFEVGLVFEGGLLVEE